MGDFLCALQRQLAGAGGFSGGTRGLLGGGGDLQTGFARLFESGDDLRNLDWVRSRPVPRPSAKRADIEPDLDAVAMRLLERA